MRPGWYDSRTMIRSWLPAPDHTHWCHSAERPTHDPTAPAAPEWIKDAVHEITLHSFGAIHNLKEETAYRQTIEGIIARHAPATPASSAAKGGDIPRTPTDSEMLDWLEKQPGSVYASIDADGDVLLHFVAVPELPSKDRRGFTAKTVRAAIAAAMMKGVRG